VIDKYTGMKKLEKRSMIPLIEKVISISRGSRIIMDFDLAAIYGISTNRLNQQVRRNRERFPEDFVFELTKDEVDSLMLQSATSKPGRGGRRKPAIAFTEHGVIMAANVLRSERAIQMSVFVVRAFIKMRATLAENKLLAAKLEELERKLTGRVDKHEEAIVYVLNELKKLREPVQLPTPKKRSIGFGREMDSKR
jgi:hypothetical protein